MVRSQSDCEDSAVLIFLIGSLGDTIVALPALHRLRARYRGRRFVLLTNTPVDGGIKAASSVQILDGSGLIDEYIEYPHGSASPYRLLKVIRKVRKASARTGAYLMRSRSPSQLRRDRLFFRLCGIRSMLGLGSRTVEHLAPRPGSNLWESEAARMLRCVGSDGAALSAADFSLNLSAFERKQADEILRGHGLPSGIIAVGGGTKVEVNDWGEDRWHELICTLGRYAGDHGLLFVGSADEGARASRLASFWPGVSVNLCGQLKPRQSAAVLERASLFIGHNSGPMHLAASVGKSTVAIFSAREMPGIWFPFGQEQNVFYRDVPCRDCRLEACVEHAKRCIRDIEPHDVVQRVVTQLRRSASPGG